MFRAGNMRIACSFVIAIACSRVNTCNGELLAKLPRQSSVHRHDLFNAIDQQRSKAQSIPRFDEMRTFKGYIGEVSLRRRMQAKAPDGVRWEAAPKNDRIADLVRFEPDGRKVIVQQYDGAKARPAFEKLLGSDAAADELYVARDVYAKMKTALKEVEDIWKRVESKELDEITAMRQSRHRLKGTGLRVEAADRSLNMDTREGVRLLGKLGTGEVMEKFSRVKSDTLTSAQKSRNALYALLDPSQDTPLGRFARIFKIRSPSHVKPVEHAIAARRDYYRAKGHDYWMADRKASHWFEYTEVPRLLDQCDRDIRRAVALGVPEEAIAAIDASPRFGSLAERADEISKELRRESAKAGIRQHAVGQGVTVVFLFVGTGLDVYLSDADLAEWLRSDAASEWLVRGALSSAIVAASIELDRQLTKKAVEKIAGASSRSALIAGSQLGRRLIVGAVAGALFVAGDTLIAVLARGESLAEVSGHVYESIFVMVITEAAFLGASKYAAAYGAGSAAGPIGIAVAVGMVAIYEGVKYAWTVNRDLKSSTLITLLKADFAQRKSQEFYRKLVRTSGG